MRRQSPGDWRLDPEELLGDVGGEYVDDLLRSARPGPLAARLLTASMQEVDLGLCSRFYDRSHFDALFGRGWWRPLWRHLIVQGFKFLFSLLVLVSLVQYWLLEYHGVHVVYNFMILMKICPGSMRARVSWLRTASRLPI